MKKYIIFLLGMGYLSCLEGQAVTQDVFETVLDRISCILTDVSLKDEPDRPHYLAFKQEVGNQCDFITLVEFLKRREPEPLIKNLELVAAVNSFKSKYNPTFNKEDLAFIVQTQLFAHEALKAFRLHPARKTTYFKLKQNIDAYVATAFNLGTTTTTTITDYDEAEDDDVTMVIEQETEEEPEQIPPIEELEQEAKEAQQLVDTEDLFTENDFEPTPFLSWSHIWFQLAILLLLFALILRVALPFAERRYKKYMKNKSGNAIHPTVLGIKADIEGLKSEQRLLKEAVKSLNYDLDELIKN